MTQDTVFRSHKIRLGRLSNKQKAALHQAFGASRFCYNQAKAVSDEHYRQTNKTLSKLALRNHLVQVTKKENEWLRELPKSLLEEAVFDYASTRQSFFSRGHGFPKFRKRRDESGSFTLNNEQFSIQGKRLYLANISKKVGAFRLTEELRFHGKLLSLTVTQRGSRYYASVAMEIAPDVLPQTGAEVGVDLNLHSIVTSDNVVLPHASFFRDSQRKLARAQRVASRRAKGSANRRKALRRVRKLHEEIAFKRVDAHHKMSHQLVKDNSFIFLEDLNVQGMVKNRHLSKAISDASFHQLVSQIQYKAETHGRVVVKIGRFYPSSKTCSSCGQVKTKLGLGERVFRCERCGLTIDRDYNAALNIRAEGSRLLPLDNSVLGPRGSNACGDSVRHALDSRVGSVLESQKQEPIRVPV